MTFINAFAFEWDEEVNFQEDPIPVLGVVTEHQGTHVWAREDLKYWNQFEQTTINTLPEEDDNE
jgi:hypothetical protein